MNTIPSPESQGSSSSAFPESLHKWSWGGFFLNWIWGVFNETWISLLCFTGVGAIIMPFVLGYKGREWAWKNRKWDSIEHFNAVQRKWDFWGILIGVISTLVSVVIFAVTIFFAALVPETGITGSSEPIISSNNSIPPTSVLPVENKTLTPPVEQVAEPVAVPVKPTFELRGIWTSSTTDDIAIVQNGDKLVGKYSYEADNGGKTEGSFEAEIVAANIVKGTWTEAPVKRPREIISGPMEFKLSDDGAVLDGWYGNVTGTERSPWVLKRKR